MGWWNGVDKRAAHSQNSGEQSPRGNSFVGEGKEKLEGGRRQILVPEGRHGVPVTPRGV